MAGQADPLERPGEPPIEDASPGLTASVVIPTYNRPERVRTCLEHLQRQTVPAVEIVVVDGSPDDRTELVVAEFPGVTYLRNTMGRGATPESRRMGVERVTADVVAFLDDDANARPDWLAQLLARYADPEVGGVGGAALNNIPGEREEGLGSVGLLLPDGRLTGFFAADTGHDLQVDHLLGANMSFRRTSIERIGGVHGGYPGTCLREESDLALRIRNNGEKLIFTPHAIVEHLPGPYAKGKRFDRRYSYYGNRNHIVLLARTFGFTDPILRRFLVTAGREVKVELLRAAHLPRQVKEVGAKVALRNAGGGVTRAAALGAGLVTGFPAAVVQVRRDAALPRAVGA